MGKGVMTDAVVALKRVSELKRQGGEKNEEEIRNIIKANFGEQGLAHYQRLSSYNLPAEKIVSLLQDMANKMERFGKKIEKAIKEQRLKAEQAEKEAIAKQQAQIVAAQKEAVERQKRLDEAQKFFDELKEKRRKLLADKDKHLADKKKAEEEKKKAEKEVSDLDKENKKLAAEEKGEKDGKKRDKIRRRREENEKKMIQKRKAVEAWAKRIEEANVKAKDIDARIATTDQDLKMAQKKRDEAIAGLRESQERLAALRGQGQKKTDVQETGTPLQQTTSQQISYAVQTTR